MNGWRSVLTLIILDNADCIKAVCGSACDYGIKRQLCFGTKAQAHPSLLAISSR